MILCHLLQALFQLALCRDKKRAWRSNRVGLLTTLVVLVVLAFSSVPLIRELMIFSILGLLFSFGFLFLFSLIRPGMMDVRPFALKFRFSRLGAGITGVLVLCAMVGPFLVTPSLDIKQMEFQPAETREVRNWLFSQWKSAPPLFTLNEPTDLSSALAFSRRDLEFARKEGIQVRLDRQQ